MMPDSVILRPQRGRLHTLDLAQREAVPSQNHEAQGKLPVQLCRRPSAQRPQISGDGLPVRLLIRQLRTPCEVVRHIDLESDYGLYVGRVRAGGMLNGGTPLVRIRGNGAV